MRCSLRWARPSAQQLSAFNVECCRRIRELIFDAATHEALDGLEKSSDRATVPAELALRANRVGATSADLDEPRNFSAAKAVAHAVCRCLPPDSDYYWTDPVDNSRLVAFYCQWAVAHAADPADEEERCDEECTPLSWLADRARTAEASAQCDIIRKLFTRRAEPGPDDASADSVVC